MKLELDAEEVIFGAVIIAIIFASLLILKGCEIERQHAKWMTEHSITNQVNK